MSQRRIKPLDPENALPGNHHDHVVRLLQLRVSPKGTRTWHVQLRERGRRPKRHIVGRWPDVTVEDARKRVLGLEGKLRDGAPFAANDDAPTTFGALRERYLGSEDFAQLRPDTQRGYRHKLQSDHVRVLDAVLLGNLGKRELQRVREHLVKRKLKPATIMAVLHGVLAWAEDHGYIESTPQLRRQRRGAKPTPRPLIRETIDGLDFSELTCVMRAVDEFERLHPASPWPAIYRISAFTGWRATFVVRLRWEMFSALDNGAPMLEAEGGDMKAGRSFRVPLSSAVGVILRALQPQAEKRTGKVFGVHQQQSKVQAEIAQLAKVEAKKLGRADVFTRPWSRKDFRATFRTWLDSQEVSLRVARAAMAHADPHAGHVEGRYSGAERLGRLQKVVEEWATAVERCRA